MAHIDKIQAHAARILVNDDRISHPFDVPTLTLYFNDFAAYADGGKDYYVPLMEALFLGFTCKMGWQDQEFMIAPMQSFKKHIKAKDIRRRMQDYKFIPNHYAGFAAYSKREHFYAHEAISGTAYCGPLFSMVVLSPETMTANDYLSCGLNAAVTPCKKDFPDFSAFSEQVHYYMRWHEYAHGTGAAEPQADKMAAMMTKKTYQSSAVVKFMADSRMAIAVILAGKNTLEKYGWSMVEANDQVATIPQDILNDVMTEEVIKAIRFQKFGHHGKDVLRVRDIITTEMKGNFLIAKMADVGVAARKLSNDHRAPLSAQQRTIMRRFALAVERLSTGPQAYGEEEKIVQALKSVVPAGAAPV